MTEFKQGPTIAYKDLPKEHLIGKCIFSECRCGYCETRCCKK